MYLADGGEELWVELVGQVDQRGPETSVNKSDLAVEQTACEHLWRGAEKTGYSEDAMTGWVGPPAAANLLSSNELGHVGNGAMGRLEQDACVAQQLEHFGVSHGLRILGRRKVRGVLADTERASSSTPPAPTSWWAAVTW
jgi:hypothetical protein